MELLTIAKKHAKACTLQCMFLYRYKPYLPLPLAPEALNSNPKVNLCRWAPATGGAWRASHAEVTIRRHRAYRAEPDFFKGLGR